MCASECFEAETASAMGKRDMKKGERERERKERHGSGACRPAENNSSVESTEMWEAIQRQNKSL